MFHPRSQSQIMQSVHQTLSKTPDRCAISFLNVVGVSPNTFLNGYSPEITTTDNDLTSPELYIKKRKYINVQEDENAKYLTTKPKIKDDIDLEKKQEKWKAFSDRCSQIRKRKPHLIRRN